MAKDHLKALVFIGAGGTISGLYEIWVVVPALCAINSCCVFDCGLLLSLPQIAVLSSFCIPHKEWWHFSDE